MFTILSPVFADNRLAMRFAGPVLGTPTVFSETVDLGGLTVDGRVPAPPDPAIVTLTTLCCALSYYKATPDDTICVEFPVTDAAVTFLREIIAHGLGEYAYRNGLPGKLTPDILVPQSLGAPDAPAHPAPSTSAPLLPVGGGKDSIVALEAVVRSGRTPELYSVQQFPAITATAATAGLRLHTAWRSVDPALLRANAAGAPNGHVPVTAINSLIGLLAAERLGLGPVIFANEASANYPNVRWGDRIVNHQWSKSLAFEDLLRTTLAAHGRDPDGYFSLLRGMHEFNIARAFATLSAYHPVFSSCNRAYVRDPDRRVDRWCRHCAKCVFTFTILAPWMRRDDLVAAFGGNVLDDHDNADLLRDILGLGDPKPFDCVGEPWEAADALSLLARDATWRASCLVARFAPEADRVPRPADTTEPDRVPAAYRNAANIARALAAAPPAKTAP